MNTTNPQHLDKDSLTEGFVIGGMSKSNLKKTYFSSPKTTMKSSSNVSAGQSFILNSDMVKIRQAELIILKEEEKFGIHARDAEGRVFNLYYYYY